MKNNSSVVLGTRKGVLILVKQGKGWQVTRQSFPGLEVSYAFRHPYTNDIWAALETGHWGPKLHRSPDGGSSWQEIQLPEYPQGAEINPGVPAALSYIWMVCEGHAQKPNQVFLGTEPGGLFLSEDRGETFDLVNGLWDHPSRDQWFGGGRDYPGLHSLVIDPRDPLHWIAGISVGGVYESKDGGVSWTPRNKGLIAEYLPNPAAEVGHDPHLLVASPGDPDTLWQQNHCGIFRSVDSAQNWKKVSEEDGPAHFGFAVAVDEQDPGTAWVIPAVSDEVRIAVDGAMCVSQTQDGGKSWKHHREGLPQENCYDFTFRHAVDIRGDRLMFGTATGNLFVSEDRGESWECISNYFPPIYSVRFI